MKQYRFGKAFGATAALGAVLAAGILASSTRGQASDRDKDDQEWFIQRGFEIAPVPLNLIGKDPALVGLGSYICQCSCSL